MGAGLGGDHAVALAAEESVLEEERRDAELVRIELVEDVLGVEGAVEGADARVVAAHDEVGAAVVLAAEGVEDRLPRTRVAHGGGEDGEHRPVPREVPLEAILVGVHPDVGWNVVVRAGLADDGVEEQAVDRLEGALLDVLEGAVDRLPRLEADY